MSSFARIFCCITLVCGLVATAQTAPVVTPPSDIATSYLTQVLDLMQANALHTKEIDWTAVRRETLARAAGARTTAETYPAVAYALTQLKERHSFLRLPDTMPEAAKRSIVARMDRILGPFKSQFPSRHKSVFRERSAPAGKLIHMGDAVFADVIVPACVLPAPQPGVRDFFQNYADSLHSAAAALEARHPLGWIIDLRGNRGGDMWPMLAGLGFVLGEGRLGYFVSVEGKADDYWFYRQGAAGDSEGGHETAHAKVTQSPLTLPSMPPVAVLLDGGTASSGEATAISFIGRPNTRSFGGHTAGFTTANNGFLLPDGAMLFLSTTIEEDRNHRMYPDGVEPDVLLIQPTVKPSEAADPVLKAAERWLLYQGTRTQAGRL